VIAPWNAPCNQDVLDSRRQCRVHSLARFAVPKNRETANPSVIICFDCIDNQANLLHLVPRKTRLGTAWNTTTGKRVLAEAIDTHIDFVPQAIALEPARNTLWPSIKLRDQDGAAVMIGGKVFRGIDSRRREATRRIDDMVKDDVDVQVASPMPELLSHWFPAPRLRHASSIGSPLNSLFGRDPGETARASHCDTILCDQVALDYLAVKVGCVRLVVGSDYPFTIKRDRPAEFAERMLAILREIFEGNARRRLGLER